VFTICMFSLTAEYKRTNSYDECITMKMHGIWLDTLSDLKPGIASWGIFTGFNWIENMIQVVFFLYNTSWWRNYLLHYLPKIAMQMTTFRCNHRIDMISWRQPFLVIHQEEHNQTWSRASFWSKILCRLSHPNVELHYGISVAVSTCYCLIKCFKCSGEWRNRKSLSEPQCNIVI